MRSAVRLGDGAGVFFVSRYQYLRMGDVSDREGSDGRPDAPASVYAWSDDRAILRPTLMPFRPGHRSEESNKRFPARVGV